MDNRLKKTLFCLSIVFSFSVYFAQQVIYKSQLYNSKGDVFGTRNFIQNTGAYTNPLDPSEKVDYVYECAGEKIYFSKSGLIIEHGKTPIISEALREELEENNRSEEYLAKRAVIQMRWQQASPNLTIEPGERQVHYFTYGGPELNAALYKKLTYKNVYPNIDVVYEIPNDKPFGIKYSLHLHPGARLSDIDMLYSGDIKKAKLEKDGSIVIASKVDEIREHAPYSFYSNGKLVDCKFSFAENHITFKSDEQIDSSKELVIDPWLTTITTLLNDNNGYDVDFDFAGNLYVYGGNTAVSATAGRCKVAKYSPTGTLIWTFAGFLATPTWSTGSSWSSNFKVNRGLGKTYVSKNTGAPNAIRLDVNGNYDNWITSGTPSVQESWAMDLICNGDLLIFGGASTSGQIVDTQTGNITLVTTFSPGINGCCQDIVSFAIDATGDMFVYFLGHTQLNHKIGKLSQTFTTSIWHAPSGFNTFVYLQNKNLYQGSAAGPAVAFNALAVNMNYLFYYDGVNVAAYDKLTGNLAGSTSITGYVGRTQGGIAVDDCNNVYVGGVNMINCFNFNGTTFSTLTPISFGASATNQYVYDISLNSFNSSLFVSGSGFVASYAAIHSTLCALATVSNPCSFGQGTITAQTTSITCANLGSATVSAIGGVGPFTYTWLPSMTTGSVISGVAPGTHSVIVSDQTTNFTYTALAVFNPLVPLTGNLNSSGSVPCFGMNTATASLVNLQGGSGNQFYSYTDGTNTQTTAVAVNLAAGNYTATVVDALTGCKVDQPFTIIQPAALNAFIIPSSPTVCVGDSVSLNNIVSGGVPAYTNTWSVNGANTSTTMVSSSVAGPVSFSVFANDGNTCPVNAMYTVTFVPLPAMSAPVVSICPLETATLSASGASSYSWNGTGGTSVYTDNPSNNTTYTLTGSALGCSNTITTSVVIKPLPTPQINSNSPVCENGTINIISSGGTSYVWAGPLSYTSTSNNPIIANAGLTNAGVYNVTVTAANSCTAATSQSVVVNPVPVVAASGSTVCTSQTLNLSSNSSLPVSYLWFGPAGFSNTNQNPVVTNPALSATGNYTVKATTVNGCFALAVANVSITSPPSLSLSLSQPTMCAQAFNGSPNTITLSPLGATSYSLFTTINVNAITNNPPYVISPAAPFSGVLSPASLTLTGSNGVCTSNQTYTVQIVPNPNVSIVSSTPAICIGISYQYSLSGADFYNWIGTTNGLQTTANGAYATPSVTSTYSVIGTRDGCTSAPALHTMTVYPLPIMSVAPSTYSICYGTSTTIVLSSNASSHFWNPPFGLSSISNATVTAKPLSNTVYTIIGTANGCTTAITTSVTVLALPQPTAVAEKTAICLYQPVTLFGKGANSYWWKGPLNYGDFGETVSFNAINPGMGGNYILVGKDEKGCIDSSYITIVVNPLPDASLWYDAKNACVPFCPAFKTIPSNTNSAVKAKWVINNRTYSARQFTTCLHEAGDYKIEGNFTDSLTGCVGAASQTITVYPTPLADFNWLPKEPIEAIEEVKFNNLSSGEDIVSYQWQFKDEFSIGASTVKNPRYTWMTQGLYPVALLVTNQQGCKDTALYYVNVLEDHTLYIPNSFTPNNDSKNDVFVPVVKAARNYELHVYNRWGEELFFSKTIGEGWDGSYSGKPCKEDVYTWTLALTTRGGQRVVKTGSVTLIR